LIFYCLKLSPEQIEGISETLTPYLPELLEDLKKLLEELSEQEKNEILESTEK